MRFNIAVGSHHKTGTHWMRDVFKSFARARDHVFVDLGYVKPEKAALRKAESAESGRKLVVFHNQSRFGDYVDGTFRGVRIIRDPRDVLVSALKYHLSTDAGWITRRKPEFGKTSIQQHLRALPDDESRYLFEIEHVIGRTLRRMADFDHGAVFADIKYEDLVVDRDLAYTKLIYEWLGLEEDDLEPAYKAMWDNSLFGGLNPEGNDHINDGSARQFERKLSPEVQNAFMAAYGDICAKLGYLDRPNANEVRSRLDRTADGAPVHGV